MQISLPNTPILDTLRMKSVLAGVADPQGKIARMLSAGELIALRRGLYASRRDLDPLSLAGPIHGPSYLSFETALAWHGMIPEAVPEILSATLKRPASFSNAFGNFRYLSVPKAVYPVGVLRSGVNELFFLIASPTKALADRIAREPGFRSLADIRRWIDAMRITLDAPLDRDELAACADGYGRPSVRLLGRFAEKHDLCASCSHP